jgi:ABC-2 type transport system ATP-binding protein
MTPLQVEGAQKRYGQVEALAGVSFEVRPAELVGLLGPNGAGKTTLIKAIAGRLKLDAGTIQLFGRALSARDPRPEIGIVPQEIAVYDKLTARENLEVFGRLYGVPGAKLTSRVTWALAWSDLKDRADEVVGRFSGGMKRRLNIACGLLHSPSIVLLDEPTVGVDPQSRERIYGMLAELRGSGVSVVLTTHHLEEAEQRCERIVIIDRGRIAAAGTLDELLRASLGRARVLTLALDAPWPVASPAAAGARFSDDRRQVIAEIQALELDVPRHFAAASAAGVRIADMKIAGATLHDAFIALTGRELRD